MRDDTTGDHPGCRLTLTNRKTGEQRGLETYSKQTMQVPAGRYGWTVNDELCHVVRVDGAGTHALPLVAKAYTGDTDAFAVPGPVSVLATLGSGSTECELTLNAVADGKPLAFGTAVKGKGPGAARDARQAGLPRRRQLLRGGDGGP